MASISGETKLEYEQLIVEQTEQISATSRKIQSLFAFVRDFAKYEVDQSLTIVQTSDHFDWYTPE